MPSTTTSPATSAAISSDNRLAIATLLLLAPLIGEVLSGATRLSFIFAFIPEIMVWGCGALLIREAVRRWRGGWVSVLCLGLALSVAEESSSSKRLWRPLNWMGATSNGRVWGVNLFYFLFMLAYEPVWIVLVPIQVTELIFPQRREQPWLRTRGILISVPVFILGSFMAWFLWIKQARPNAFHVPDYHPPLATFAVRNCGDRRARLFRILASDAAGRASLAESSGGLANCADDHGANLPLVHSHGSALHSKANSDMVASRRRRSLGCARDLYHSTLVVGIRMGRICIAGRCRLVRCCP